MDSQLSILHTDLITIFFRCPRRIFNRKKCRTNHVVSGFHSIKATRLEKNLTSTQNEVPNRQSFLNKSSRKHLYVLIYS